MGWRGRKRGRRTAYWCKGSEPRALFVFVGPHSVIRLRNALRPSSFPPPYPPLPSSYLSPRAHRPSANPSVSPPPSPRHPSSACSYPLPSTGGSNGCGGICQAVTHPHTAVFSDMFLRVLCVLPRARFIPVTSFPSFLPSFPPPTLPRFCPRNTPPRRTDLHPSVHPFAASTYVTLVLIFHRRATSPRADVKKRGGGRNSRPRASTLCPSPPSAALRGIRFARGSGETPRDEIRPRDSHR